jgi:hypothetical protein
MSTIEALIVAERFAGRCDNNLKKVATFNLGMVCNTVIDVIRDGNCDMAMIYAAMLTIDTA